MKKIAAVTVLFNPGTNTIDNIMSYIDSVSKLYVIDNTPEKNNNNKLLPKNKKIKYISNNKNLGIATALNIGAREALKDGFEFLLTMDQDSKFTGKNLPSMITFLEESSEERIGLISPWHEMNIGLEKQDAEVDYPLTVMTSGNIINLDAYKNVGGFNDDLFIDGVDFEYCLKLKDNNYKVIRFNKSELKHELGNIKVDKFLWKNVTHSNHSYIRRYYITRNFLYINKLYCRKYPVFHKQVMREIRRDIIKIILLENDKYRKLRNMIRGYFDYKKGILGEYKYKN